MLIASRQRDNVIELEGQEYYVLWSSRNEFSNDAKTNNFVA